MSACSWQCSLGTVAAILLLTGCRDSTESRKPTLETTAAGNVVFTVNYPLAYFAHRIGGDNVNVRFPVPQNADPAHWQPSPETIVQFQSADLILLNGAGYAGWIQRATLPGSRLVDTSRSFADKFMTLTHQVVHRHGPEGKHSHAGTATNVWLDPQLAALQAQAICDAFVRQWPQRTKQTENNCKSLLDDLSALDRDLAAACYRLKGTPVVFSHPLYQYLSRRYELDARSVHWEPELTPDPDEWMHLQRMLEEHRARVFVWEAPPIAESAAKLESLGLTSIVFAPCASSPPDGDFLDAMRLNVESLAQVALMSEGGSNSSGMP